MPNKIRYGMKWGVGDAYMRYIFFQRASRVVDVINVNAAIKAQTFDARKWTRRSICGRGSCARHGNLPRRLPIRLAAARDNPFSISAKIARGSSGVLTGTRLRVVIKSRSSIYVRRERGTGLSGLENEIPIYSTSPQNPSGRHLEGKMDGDKTLPRSWRLAEIKDLRIHASHIVPSEKNYWIFISVRGGRGRILRDSIWRATGKFRQAINRSLYFLPLPVISIFLPPPLTKEFSAARMTRQIVKTYRSAAFIFFPPPSNCARNRTGTTRDPNEFLSRKEHRDGSCRARFSWSQSWMELRRPTSIERLSDLRSLSSQLKIAVVLIRDMAPGVSWIVRTHPPPVTPRTVYEYDIWGAE